MISNTQLVWTAFWVFVVSYISQSQSNSPKNRKEKLIIAAVITLLFTPIILGLFFVVGD